MSCSFSAERSTARAHLAAAISCALIIIGLFTTSFFRILPSIGIAGLTVTALAYAVAERRVAQWSRWRLYGSWVVVFMLHLGAGVYTEMANSAEYWRDVVRQSPFLLLPLAFWLLPPLPAFYLRRLWLLFLGLVTVCALGSTINYLLHAAEINQLYRESKVMPTEPDHIRFSLMVSLAIGTGVLILLQWAARGWERRALACVLVFLVFYQHLLAVRSGIMTFYAMGGLTLIWLFWGARKYKLGVMLLTVLVFLPLMSFVCLPTFRNKFHNTREDIGKVQERHSANNYSLVGRVYSYKVAMMLAEEHPWFGTGNADMMQEIGKKYQQSFPTIHHSSYLKPHNQFLYCLVAFGCIGLALFTFGFYLPGIQLRFQTAPLLLLQYVIITLSFLVEYTLETQVGLTFALLFLLLPIVGVQRAEENLANRRHEGWCPT